MLRGRQKMNPREFIKFSVLGAGVLGVGGAGTYLITGDSDILGDHIEGS
jgi:hypothetical protein